MRCRAGNYSRSGTAAVAAIVAALAEHDPAVAIDVAALFSQHGGGGARDHARRPGSLCGLAVAALDRVTSTGVAVVAAAIAPAVAPVIVVVSLGLRRAGFCGCCCRRCCCCHRLQQQARASSRKQ
jgi:hypothetical protein